MAKSEMIVGLDIGTTKICAVVGEVDGEGVNIVGIGTSPSTGLRKGVVVNIEQTVQSIKRALEEAELMAGCEIRSVYAGIAGSHIKGFNSHGVIAVKGGEVTARDIERVLDAAKAVAIPLDREVIHILPQEYIVDDQTGIIDPLGMAGVRLEVKVHIVTGAVTSAQNIVKSCHKSGLDVEDIVLEALASSKAVLTDEEREIGVALVDIGGGTSDIIIFHGNSIKHTGAVPLGGANLTNDIAFGLRTPTQAAERIKVRYGCALAELVHEDDIIEVPSVGGREPRRLSRQVLAEICEPRMEEMLMLVDQELVRSGYKHLIGAGVVLTGGASRIEGIQELSERIFNLPTRTASPMGVGGLRDVVDNPMYATAVGLLLYGAEQHGQEHRIRIRDTNVFHTILSRMKKWFADIS
ncbi:cell division protein FtsA [Thermodesulfomicrobium sp. WS]|uniref:cell division protein FtsA n=1 Tax=Thermodesulfomicrobium sp. WS TaxID=3004129 RepID=UPI0024937C3A|nr:cell division protein FtsA [Thermodesulfomicrobium sp. WS]BDV00903.1 cell division protein FtsA [Thermodesulfomicrobium sp. WS]